ncbi:MAG: hypothetical protein NTW29_08650 [Bacteroidetes bacterium]|nr:hypothetical protein [Bacteroidota bacterium]
MKKKGGFFCILAVLIVVSCKQKKEALSTNEVSPENIYYDFQVNAAEGNDSVTILANFREFDEFGYSLKLDTPSVIMFDGTNLPGTTLEIPGTFYETQRSLADFAGMHRFQFNDRGNQPFSDSFTFRPLTLTSQLPPVVTDSILVLEFEGLDTNDLIHITLTDTSYAGEGIERIDTAKNARIVISASELAGLTNGPVQLELARENVRPLLQRRRPRGKISITYRLRREFTLSRNQ